MNVVNCKQDVHFNESFRPGGGRKGKDYYNKNLEISKNKQSTNAHSKKRGFPISYGFFFNSPIWNQCLVKISNSFLKEIIIRLKTNLLKAKHLTQFTSFVTDHIISQIFQWISVYCKVRKCVLRSWDMGRTLKHISDHLCLLASLNVNMLSCGRHDFCTCGPVTAGFVLQLVNWSPAAGSLDFFKVNHRHGHPVRADKTSVRLSGHETLMRTKVLHISYTHSIPSPTHIHTCTHSLTPLTTINQSRRGSCSCRALD